MAWRAKASATVWRRGRRNANVVAMHDRPAFLLSGSVEIVKTHYPERRGYKEFEIAKAIVLVRNPFDAIDSYFNMAFTNTHNVSLEESIYEQFRREWELLVSHEIRIWARFYTFWFTREIPLLAIRYEDALCHTDEVLRRMIAFYTSSDYSQLEEEEPALLARAREILTINSNDVGPYQPRSGGVGKSLRHFSAEQIEEMCNVAGQALKNFGYHPGLQGFPESIAARPPPPLRHCMREGDDGASVSINAEFLLREADDRFGRNISRIRKKHTNFDRNPLPVQAAEEQRSTENEALD
mmetsp:Transcript_14259/g.53621  ORF Transcript_14259/g.53621 Transcript_14259/m.53621 type:complete len:296 (+) Transcript_14259:413-1300(+)